MSSQAFFPQPVYAPTNATVPRVLLAPPKYVQGPGVLAQSGRYCSMLGYARVGILASARGHSAEAGQVFAALKAADIDSVAVVFGGECSKQEIDGAVAALTEQQAEQKAEQQIDALLAVGGGKCVDAGKCVAYRLGVPIVIIHTLASNDAPCSAVAVLYTPDGVVNGAEFFPHNPALVVVDTKVVANASERYLVAGMGDAMATWFEAKVCLDNPQARNVVGSRPTLAACAIGEACAATLFADGEAAALAVREKRVDDALERVVEANTLLSGIGFESGGLAAAHGLAEGYTALPEVEHNFLHGEMVGMGVLTQLALQGDTGQARKVSEFFARIGLPIHLGQLGLSANDEDALGRVAQGAMGFAPIHNLPFTVTAEKVYQAILEADALGQAVAADVGDSTYQRVQASA